MDFVVVSGAGVFLGSLFSEYAGRFLNAQNTEKSLDVFPVAVIEDGFHDGFGVQIFMIPDVPDQMFSFFDEFFQCHAFILPYSGRFVDILWQCVHTYSVDKQLLF
ncbi:MAG: hypothetical protein ACOCUL_03165 [Bacteroidota bacterium]